MRHDTVTGYTFDLMDCFASPVMTHSEDWKDSIPDRLLKVIPMARLLANMQKERFATLPETVAFIMTRTYEAPLDSDWAEIYLHVSCTVCQEYFQEDHWEKVKAHRELSEWQQQQLLMPLRRWIFERRRMALKERLKKQTPPVNKPEDYTPAIMQTQLSFKF